MFTLSLIFFLSASILSGIAVPNSDFLLEYQSVGANKRFASALTVTIISAFNLSLSYTGFVSSVSLPSSSNTGYVASKSILLTVYVNTLLSASQNIGDNCCVTLSYSGVTTS